MTLSRLTDQSLRLRAPAWAFAGLGLAIIAIVALGFAALVSAGFSRFFLETAMALTLPGAIGAALVGPPLWARLKNDGGATLRDVVQRAAIGFAVAGFVWPLSFGLAIGLQGDFSGAVAHALPVLLGAVLGGIGGALGGFAAARVCLVNA